MQGNTTTFRRSQLYLRSSFMAWARFNRFCHGRGLYYSIETMQIQHAWLWYFPQLNVVLLWNYHDSTKLTTQHSFYNISHRQLHYPQVTHYHTVSLAPTFSIFMYCFAFNCKDKNPRFGINCKERKIGLKLPQ